MYTNTIGRRKKFSSLIDQNFVRSSDKPLDALLCILNGNKWSLDGQNLSLKKESGWAKQSLYVLNYMIFKKVGGQMPTLKMML